MVFRNKSNDDLKIKLKAMQERIRTYEPLISDTMKYLGGDKIKYIVFLSVCGAESRAFVCKGMGNTIDTGWKNAADLLNKHIRETGIDPVWIKADLVTDVQEYTFGSFMDYISGIKTNYFREGIAFDPMFNTAFLEQEVNANVFIDKDNKNKSLPAKIIWNNINFYLKKNQGIKNRELDGETVKNVYTFKTVACFHDGKTSMDLLNGRLDNGRRNIDKLDKAFLNKVIGDAAHFLAEQVYDSGMFRYGYFPCFDKEVPSYNILRHASSTYAMIEAYEIVRDPALAAAIERSLSYLEREGIETGKGSDGVERAFVIERSRDDEIKLGANAAAILAMAKYTKVFGDDRFKDMMIKLGNGIAYFQNQEDGSYVHVLNFPDLSIKDRQRVIYYDGEATFALMRLYDIDRDQRWLDMAEKAFEHFISEKYWRHSDHWLSYCSNELIKYKPDRKYIDFNLQNASGILDFCLIRETTYPTLLELLMATYHTISKIRSDQIHTDLMDDFDEEKFMKALQHRAEYQLNGLFFPEFAMYFKAPSKIAGAFYIRHHSFRSRIDDNEHYISGYCNYYNMIAKD